jgi:S-adenosyl-L-methionine hydrolase (adenosine-forming)
MRHYRHPAPIVDAGRTHLGSLCQRLPQAWETATVAPARRPHLIALFTDFGLEGPYTGQMKAVLARDAPGVPAIDLFADAPASDPVSGAYLLAAYSAWWPPGTVFLCVIDPGVGSDRAAVIVEADERWFVGPDNGLFELVIRRATAARSWEITWRPASLSASFHGRDLFAPVAAMLARGEPPPGGQRPLGRWLDWPDDLLRIVYIDHYGNAVTGLRAASLAPGTRLTAGGRAIPRARVFAEMPEGEPFWYENSNGLVEIAVNRGRADAVLSIRTGSVIEAS